MTCVVCDRNSKTLNGLEKFGNNQVNICSACKSVYYRYCEELFVFVISKLSIMNDKSDCSEIKDIIWSFLNDDSSCKNHQKFIYQNLCSSCIKPFCKMIVD